MIRCFVVVLLLAAPAYAQDYSSLHGSPGADYVRGDYASLRNGPGDYARGYAPRAPLWQFRDYPNGIPSAADRGNVARSWSERYYPYQPYRADYLRDRYNPNGVHRYPVR